LLQEISKEQGKSRGLFCCWREDTATIQLKLAQRREEGAKQREGSRRKDETNSLL